MAEGFALKADVRERTGKGAARALRRNGQIPAVIYGNNEAPTPIAVPFKEMTVALYGGGFLTNIWKIDVGGKTEQVLARDYQREPLKDRLVHVDFLRVTARSRVNVDVPVSFIGEDECPGLINGGVLSVVAFSIPVDAAATRIPDHIEVSLAGRELGDTITSDDLKLPDGVNLVADEAFPVATISAPVEEVEEEPVEAALAEGEEGEAAEGAEGEDGGDAAAEGEASADTPGES